MINGQELRVRGGGWGGGGGGGGGGSKARRVENRQIVESFTQK